MTQHQKQNPKISLRKAPLRWLATLVLAALVLLGAQACKTGRPSYQLAAANLKGVQVEGNLNANAEMEKLLSPYRQKLDLEMGKVVARSAMEMQKGPGENLLGNFVTDLLFHEAEQRFKPTPNFSLLASGGLRTPIPKGEVKVNDVFELMPFENEVVILEVSANDINVLAAMAFQEGKLNFSQCVLEGKKSGEIQTILVQGKQPIQSNTYYLCTIDYLADGGDNLGILKNKKRINTGVRLRDLLLQGMSKLEAQGKSLSASLDGRMKINP